jgi:hypothetical protein
MWSLLLLTSIGSPQKQRLRLRLSIASAFYHLQALAARWWQEAGAGA